MISQYLKLNRFNLFSIKKLSFIVFLITISFLFQMPLSAGPKGGGIPPIDKVTDRYQKIIEQGDKQKATELVLKYASQKRRAEKDRLKLYFMLTDAAIDSDDTEKYIQLIEKIKRSDVAIAHFLEVHYFNYSSVKDRVVDSIIWLAKNNSPRLSRVRTTYIWRIYRYTKEVSNELSFHFLQSLYEYGFPRSEVPLAPESLYLELVKELLARGEFNRARQVVDDVITSFESYLYIWHDNRYQALWPHLERQGKFEPKPGVNQEIKRMEEFLQSDIPKTWSEWIKVTTKLVEKKRSIAQFDEAISIAKDAIAEVPEDVQSSTNFFWLQQALAAAYIENGDWSKVRVLMNEVLSTDLKDRPQNISAVINYAGYLLERGKINDAVQMANQVLNEYKSYTSEYGQYFALAILVCAYQERGQHQKAKEQFSAMYREFNKNYYASTHAAVCMQDRSATRNILIKRIEDPEERHYTLAYLSDYTTHKKLYRKPEQMLFLQQVANTYQVRMVVEKYGRTKSWRLPQVYWGEL